MAKNTFRTAARITVAVLVVACFLPAAADTQPATQTPQQTMPADDMAVGITFGEGRLPGSAEASSRADGRSLSESETQGDATPAWVPFLSLIVAGITLIGVLVSAWLARLNAIATNYQRSNEIEITQLQAKLNGFYGPFQLISQENHIIAKEFKTKHGGEGFRTLIALLNPTWRASLSASDKAIVGTMIDNGKTLRALIRDKAGLVDAEIQPYLAKVSAHFAILEMAHGGGLENEPDRFRHYVYPQELDTVLKLEFTRLTDRIEQLIRNSDKPNGPMAPLNVAHRLAGAAPSR